MRWVLIRCLVVLAITTMGCLVAADELLELLLLFLVKMGVISRRQLQVLRPYWVIVNLVIASVVTPPDVVSAVMLALPLQILYEISVFLAKYVERDLEVPD
jgi:sec-independent protein translocase protein TatC